LSFFAELKRRNVFKVGIAYIVMAWLVMQVADVILNNIVAPDWVFQVILLLLGVGFLVAMFFAWAFEMTPEGLKREHEVDRTQSITPQTGKKLNNVIFAFMALALAYFAIDKFVLSAGRDAALVEATTQAMTEQAASDEVPAETDKSIAVLPFADMSPDKDQEYLSDGIAEELLNLLAKIPELRVTSRTSAFSYKGKDFKIADVGRELEVAHILEGSVRKAGNQVRITAQLIAVDSDTHLWSETYDRTLENIFTIQDEIAGEVVSQLKVALLGAAPTARETDPEAYALYLQARHISRMGTGEQLTRAIELFEQVLEIDPLYAEAWSELGRAQINQAGFNLVSEKAANALGSESQHRALEIDPGNAAAHSRLGWIEMSGGRFAQAAKHLQKALELEPGSGAVLGNTAQLMDALGRHEQSVKLQRKTVLLNPASAQSHANLGFALYVTGRLDEAMGSAQTAERLSPGYWGVPYLKANIFMRKQDYESALAAYALEGDLEFRARGTAMAAFSLNRMVEYEAALDQLKQGWGEQWPSEVAAVYIWTGDYDAAFEWLEKAAKIGESQLASNLSDPMLAGIHDDPRWVPFLESIGRSPEQLAAIEFKVTLRD
jgi:TolB-like protein/Tfp pilus assembly protein PilF